VAVISAQALLRGQRDVTPCRLRCTVEIAFRIAQVFGVPLDEAFRYPEGDEQPAGDL